MNKKIQSTICLLLTAIIWGSAFVAQRAGMDNMGPFLFSSLRMFLGSLALLPIIYILDKRKSRQEPEHSFEEKAAEKKILIKGGVWCGIVIFFAANFQQVGLVSVSAGKTGFITALYIILVPLFGIFLHNKTNIFNWIGVVIGVAGLYFLCITETLTIAFGDFVVLIGAVFWAAHILCMDHFAPKVDVTKLICIQFLVAGSMSMLVSVFTEDFVMSSIMAAAPILLYMGIVSSAGAFTLQGLGQKYANPTTASIILSTESLFGAISGFLILGEVFTTRELIGCILMFAAVIIAQMPTKAERERTAVEKADIGCGGE